MAVQIPRLSMAAMEATFAGWLVDDGSTVRAGDPLYRLETDKVETEVEAAVDGTVRHGDVLADEVYPVGTMVGEIVVE